MNYIIFDLEATCEHNNRNFPNEIIEIGAVKVQKNNQGELNIVDTFEQFIQPVQKPILTDFCTQLTSITQDMVDNVEQFPSVIEDFKDWVGVGKEEYILCSWGFYDKTQLKKDSKYHQLNTSWINQHISLKHQHGDILNQRAMGVKKALSKATLSFDGTHHRGIDDAKNITKLFIHFYDKWDFKIK